MKWTTEKRKISDLIPYEHNPRQMSEKQNKDLTKSLEKFDLVEIPAINTDGTILAGHQRLRIMQALGRGDEEIDVRVPDRKLTEKEVQEYNIRSNKNTGEFDFDVLANAFETSDLLEWGFDEKDLKIETEVEEDEVPEPPVEPTTKLGDLFQLGSHRLLCGDATKQEDVERLMDGQKADMVFTDPPYGVSYASKNEYLNSISPGNRIQTPIENDHMDLEGTSEFVYQAFVQIKHVLAKRSSYYITAPQGGDLMMMMMMMMQKAGIPLRHCLIWVKNNHVLGRTDYNYKHEPILYGWVDVHDFYGAGDHKFSTWEIDKPLKNDLHPTMKPVALITNALRNSTKESQIVVDFFGGSGSTLIACEQLGRRCFMSELDERYCDVIIKRWENLTGEKAVKL